MKTITVNIHHTKTSIYKYSFIFSQVFIKYTSYKFNKNSYTKGSFVSQDLTQAYLEATHRLVRFHSRRKRVPDRLPREGKTHLI